MTDIEVRLDESRERFMADVGGDEAYVSFDRPEEHVLDFTSTFVPERHRHRGVGEELVVEALEYAREHDFRVVPTCPFVEHVIEHNPEYRDLLAGR